MLVNASPRDDERTSCLVSLSGSGRLGCCPCPQLLSPSKDLGMLAEVLVWRVASTCRPAMATWVLPKWSVRKPTVREFVPPPMVETVPLPAIAEVALTSFDEPLKSVAPKRSLSQILVKVWAIVACLLLLRLIVSQILLSRLRRRSREAPLAWQESLSVLALARSAALRMSSRVHMPMTWGLVRPVIVIPEGYKNHSEAERSFVLQHECQHLAQNDTRAMARSSPSSPLSALGESIRLARYEAPAPRSREVLR